MLAFWKRLCQKGKAEYLVLVPILILAAVLRCYRIAEPGWDSTHYGISLRGVPLDGWHGFTLCEWGGVARNYLKFGYLETKLGLVQHHGWAKPFHYRVDHPPLLPLLISLSYRLFGIHEWSIRLVPLLTSLGLLPLVFWLGRKLGGKGIALIASLFFALLPVQAYYSALPVPHILGSFFSWLTIASYLRWVETRSTKWYAAIYPSFILAALSDWPSYFVVPPLLLHYLVCEYRGTKNLKFVLSFGLLPVMLLAAHLGWSYLLVGKGGVGQLFDKFLQRTISGGVTEGIYVFTRWDFYAIAYARFKFFLTPTICTLSVVWLIDFISMPLHKKLTSQDMSIAALFLFGLSQNLALSNMVYIHDFDMVFDFSPLFAILAALGARFVAEKVLFNKQVLTVPFFLIVCYLLATQATVALRRLHSVYVDADRFLIGSKINEVTDRNAIVMGDFEDYYMIFYADRSWPVVRSLQGLTSRIQTDPSYSHYILRDAGSVDEKLREYLVRNHPTETVYGYSFFDLREAGSNTILQNPRIEHPAKVNFDDKLMFLGCNVEEVVQKKQGPSWLEKYLNAHAELMPAHRTTFRITYFWQCLEEMEEDYTLVTQFDGYHGETYRIDQSHQGVNGAYPTSMWRMGEVIREEYQVEVPVDYPPVRHALWVGVRDEEEELEVVSDVEVDEENRVRLGEIEVVPAERPSPLAAEPRPQNRVAVDINDGLVFVGYDLNDRNPKPGDQLQVTTYWRKLREAEKDYAMQVELRNGGYKVQETLQIGPTRLWEEGEYYRGSAVIAINPYLLGGMYSLNLRLEGDDGTRTQVSLASLGIPCRRRHIIRRFGKASYGGSEIISPTEPLTLRFNLRERESLELVAGWTGKARGEETRVEVYLSNSYWRKKYLGTWVIGSGRYTTTKRRIARSLTAPGQNVIELRVPELRETVHNVGWRGVVDLVFPDLLQDPRTDYDGPIQMDFAQVSSPWDGNWNDYYDLAKVYADREMRSEVARLYEEAVEEGVEPGRVDEFGLFKGAYKGLGEEEKVGEIEERIAEQIMHKISVSLGGKVEFLGYSLTRQENGCAQMSLFFRCLEEMDEDYTLWMHGEVEDESLLEGQRKEAGYAVFDHLLSTSGWWVGEVYQDDEVRGLKPGRYHFTLGLWRPEDGSRLWWEDDPNAHAIDLGWVEVK
ncbi:MAG: ArnT family glycosyltransferase [Anaerolineae bacterium]